MKKYDTNFIKNYINAHKDSIDFVNCGMREDWSRSFDCIYAKSAFSDDYNWDSKTIGVSGISGSTWATPVMKVYFKGGNRKVIECYFDDGKFPHNRS